MWSVKCEVWGLECEGSSEKWEVWNVECEVWSVKFQFGVRRAQCEVWSVKCEVWSVKEAVRSEKCEVWSVKCGVWSVECEVSVWSAKSAVWSVKCEVWGLECEGSSEKWEVWSVKCEVWSVKCGVWSFSLECEEGSVKCEVWGLECEGSSEKWEVWSVKCEVWSVKFEVWSAKSAVWSVECGVWRLCFVSRWKKSNGCRGKDTVGTGCLWTIGHLCLGNFRRRLAQVYVIISYYGFHLRIIGWSNPVKIAVVDEEVNHMSLSVHIHNHHDVFFQWLNGHFRNLNWRYLPYIRPKFQGIFPQNMAWQMVLTYLHFWILKLPFSDKNEDFQLWQPPKKIEQLNSWKFPRTHYPGTILEVLGIFLGLKSSSFAALNPNYDKII